MTGLFVCGWLACGLLSAHLALKTLGRICGIEWADVVFAAFIVALGPMALPATLVVFLIDRESGESRVLDALNRHYGGTR